ncbi:hypothetical protein B0T24DRAFT_671765 [Lasiosphaeria ovina]|uniref:Uncharacterized protein n=1 Tax=Lasiosphaeria ovina TaxID=92902 RepID=A0AAE0JS39_9PEZI|nr:hypothetical protein B0T24DRAFT_671765 [Lasiosphaeria ovina]
MDFPKLSNGKTDWKATFALEDPDWVDPCELLIFGDLDNPARWEPFDFGDPDRLRFPEVSEMLAKKRRDVLEAERVKNEATPARDEATPEVKDEPMAAVKDEPPAVKDDPTAVKDEPTAMKDEPTIVKDEPTALKDEHIAVKDEPTAVKDEPTL